MNPPAPFFPPCDAPVFVVGAPRTASSFLCSALIEFAGFAGSSEGHLLPLLASLDAQVLGYYALMRKQGLLEIPENTIAKVPEHAMRHAILDVFRNYSATLFGADRWIDKTVNVGMIEALPYLLQAWPRSRVVYLGRNAISNIQSALAYFNVPFEECCLNWAQCGDAWDRIRPQLPPDRVMEISHEDLLQAPARMALSLATWLGLSSASSGELTNGIEAAVLEWGRGRPPPQTIDEVNWPEADKRTFLRICGNQMVAQGYMSESELESHGHTYRHANRVALPGALARAVLVDDPTYFRVEGDRLYIVPGRSHASLLIYENLPTRGFRSLSGTLHVSHRDSQGVRFEFIGICRHSGRIVLSGTFEIAALEKRDFTVAVESECESMDLMVRVACGVNASTNDFSWGQISELHFHPEAIEMQSPLIGAAQ